MLREINEEISLVESRLHSMAVRLGTTNWRGLGKLFTSKGLDNPEVEMLWPEYLYLKRRLEELKEHKKQIQSLLKGREE